MKDNKRTIGAALLAISVLVPIQANAWTLSTRDAGGYIITCADGKKGWFEKYPTEFACNKVCENHGGVVNIEPKDRLRLAAAHKQLSDKLLAAGLTVETDESGNSTVSINKHAAQSVISKNPTRAVTKIIQKR